MAGRVQRLVRVLLLGLAGLVGGPLFAGDFAVAPVRLELGPAARTGAFTVRNEGSSALSLQVRGMRWIQDAKGQDQYEDAKDLVYFPRLLTVEPGKEAVIRVGLRQTPTDTERTYRVFIEELPSATQDETRKAPSLAFLVRFGAPVFAKPPRLVDHLKLTQLELRQGRAQLSIRNDGNQHQIVEGIFLKGLASDGRELFSQTLTDRYLLAGTVKQYSTVLPAEACQSLSTLAAEVRTDKTRASGQIQVDRNMCN